MNPHPILLILVGVAVGVAMRACRKFPPDTPKVLGAWVINVAAPAAVLRSIHNVEIQSNWWLAAATPWLGAFLAIALIVPLCRGLGWSRRRTGALLLVGGWGNTTVVALPLIAALAGEQWLGLGLFIDLFGSFLSVSTLGLAIAAVAGSERFDWRMVARRILTFPPFLAAVIALATNHLSRPDWLMTSIDTLAMTLAPVGLAAVGFALRFDRAAGRLPAVGVGLTYRLVVGPAALFLMYLALGSTADPVAKIALLQMAMPPMLITSVIAIEYDLEPDLVALLIGIGIPLSLLTTWAWWSLIGPV